MQSIKLPGLWGHSPLWVLLWLALAHSQVFLLLQYLRLQVFSVDLWCPHHLGIHPHTSRTWISWFALKAFLRNQESRRHYFPFHRYLRARLNTRLLFDCSQKGAVQIVRLFSDINKLYLARLSQFLTSITPQSMSPYTNFQGIIGCL